MRLLLPSRRVRGVSLLEMLVYMTCLLVLIYLISVAVGKLWTMEVTMRERANALVQIVNLGERWREDVRRSAVPPKALGTDGNSAGVMLERDGKQYSYRLEDGELRRTAGAETEMLARHVVSSRMLREKREGQVYWRWELVVRLGRNATKTQAFTFIAVPGKPGIEP